jgi:hypothetical protein
MLASPPKPELDVKSRSAGSLPGLEGKHLPERERSRSEPIRGALIFENRIVDCRYRSIQIEVIAEREFGAP